MTSAPLLFSLLQNFGAHFVACVMSKPDNFGASDNSFTMSSVFKSGGNPYNDTSPFEITNRRFREDKQQRTMV